jgi:hypothetical protein
MQVPQKRERSVKNAEKRNRNRARKQANIDYAANEKPTPTLCQLSKLDMRLGRDKGAKRERAKLAEKLIGEVKAG